MIGRGVAIALLVALSSTAPAQMGTPMTLHATGSFEVTITPEAQGSAPGGGLPTSRMGLRKTFSGALAGEAHGTMLTAGTPGPGNPAAYVAVDQFEGTLDGRRGGFLLLHRGTIDKAGTSALEVAIAPDSGYGALAGISGYLAIKIEGGRHFYDLSYTLPGQAP